MNICIFSGNLTKDVELRYTNSQKAFAMFTLAVRREVGEGTDFIPCQAWERTAENLNKYCGKGSKILVEGRLQVEPYEKDGHKRTDYKVIVYKFEFLDKKEKKQEPKFEPTTEIDPFGIDEQVGIEEDDLLPF